jgi:capsular exopolysaccharide synthesis family protein
MRPLRKGNSVIPKYPFPLFVQENLPTDELYRVLFSNIERRIKEKPIRSIAVTSAVKGEGKTTTIIQLAKIAARDYGKKILLIEGDLRNPQLNAIPVSKPEADRAIGDTIVEGLHVMTLANITKNKAINGPTFANGIKKIIETVSNSYDFIFVDCPPLIPLVDMQIIANVVDGIIMVIRAEGPPRSLVNNALESIPREKVIGVILNQVKHSWSQSGYAYGYGYPY